MTDWAIAAVLIALPVAAVLVLAWDVFRWLIGRVSASLAESSHK